MWPLGPGVQASPRDDAQMREATVKLHEPCRHRAVRGRTTSAGAFRGNETTQTPVACAPQPHSRSAAEPNRSRCGRNIDRDWKTFLHRIITLAAAASLLPLAACNRDIDWAGRRRRGRERRRGVRRQRGVGRPARPEPMSVRSPMRPAPEPRRRRKRRISIPSRRRTDRSDMKKGRSREGPAPVLLPATRLMRRRRRPFSSRRRSAGAGPCPR